jgi:hypothetical protein
VAFCVLLLCLRLMGLAHKADWTITFLVMAAFTVSISSVETSGELFHSMLLIALLFACVELLPSLCVSRHMHGSH